MVGTDALKKTRKDDDRSKKSKEEVKVSPVLSVLREGWYIQHSWLWAASGFFMSPLQAFSVLPISANETHFTGFETKPVAMFGLSEEHQVWFLLTD